MNKHSSDIDIMTMLFLRYKQPIVLLDTLISDYMPHMNINTARKKAKKSQLPFPTFQTGGAEHFVNLSDFAVWLNNKNIEARQDWEKMQDTI